MQRQTDLFERQEVNVQEAKAKDSIQQGQGRQKKTDKRRVNIRRCIQRSLDDLLT